jgi:hypothetical protein
MPRPTPSRPTNPMHGDLAIACGAWAVASAGVVLGGQPLWIALMALAIPMFAFIAVGHLAGRGAVMACVASALGAGMASGSAGSSAWGAVGLIGLVDIMAMVGGLAAERMAPAAEAAVPVVGEGTWMTVVVQHEAAASETPRLAPVVTPRSVPMDRTRRHARPGRPQRAGRTA